MSLLCFGSALVDHEFSINNDQLKRLGVAKGLMTLIDEKEFFHYKEVLNSFAKPLRFGGGSAVNSLVAYRHFGGRGSFYGMVGEDDSGSFFISELENIGINVQCSVSPTTPTGHCLVLITPDGERTMLTYLGANNQITPEAPIAELVGQHQFLYAESYLLAIEGFCQTLMRYFDLARERSVKLSLSLSDVSITCNWAAQIEAVLANGVDVLFGNHAEFYSYTGKSKLDDIFAVLKEQVKTLVITKGKEGSWIYHQDSILKIPALPIVTKDTLGAGDAYAGAFLYALQRGEGYEKVGNFASYAAGQVVTRLGPRLKVDECRSIKANFLSNS